MVRVEISPSPCPLTEDQHEKIAAGRGLPAGVARTWKWSARNRERLTTRSRLRVPQASGLGSAVFGDRFETGRDIDQRHLDDIQSMFDQFFGDRRA